MGGIKRDEKRVVRRRGGQGKRGGWSSPISRPPTRRRVLAELSSSAIQRIFQTCRAIFNCPGTVPTPHDVQLLQLLLDEMKPEDVGLSTDLLFFKNENRAAEERRNLSITYTNIYTCNTFSICIFFLPATAVIPLHNHPGMTVFNKLLLGSIHIKSYDWITNNTSSPSSSSEEEEDDEQLASSRLARVVEDSDFTAPCKASVLFPSTGGNIHRFRAITPCALLDILGPPYSKDVERDCTYYLDRCTSVSSVSWLKEIDVPKELKIDGIEYMGPKIIHDH